MRVAKKFFSFLLALLMITSIAACTKQVRYSGFLSNYSGLEKGPKGGVDLAYIKQDVDFKKYKKIMMDQVVFYFSKESEYKGIRPEEMQELADKFHKKFAEIVGNDYLFTDTPGTDVIRIRTAITDIEQNNPGIGARTTTLPAGIVASSFRERMIEEHTGVGSASMEMEVLDSMTNERLAAAVDTRSCGKLAGWSKYGAVEEGFEFWAKRLKKRLDEIHGRE